MKPTNILLEQFSVLKQQLLAQKEQLKNWFNRSDLIFSSCFYAQSDDIQEYLDELEININKLSTVRHQVQSEYLSERITEQFACLKSLLNSVSLSKKHKQQRPKPSYVQQVKTLSKKVNQGSQELYAELSKLQEYERRLVEMVEQKQLQLSSYKGNKLKGDYQQQVLLTQQRLGRCRQAISKVEEDIQRLDAKQSANY